MHAPHDVPDSVAVPAGVFRIVVVGDSVTAGAGVEEDDAYPARLEAALAARGPSRRHEVVNLGMPGLNLAQLVRRLEHVGLRYHPHLIVYGWTVNDIVGPGYVALRPRVATRGAWPATTSRRRRRTSSGSCGRTGCRSWISSRRRRARTGPSSGTTTSRTRRRGSASEPSWTPSPPSAPTAAPASSCSCTRRSRG